MGRQAVAPEEPVNQQQSWQQTGRLPTPPQILIFLPLDSYLTCMNIVQGDRAGLSLVLPVHQWTQATSIAVATPLPHVQLTQLHRLSLLLPDCCGRDATSHTTSRHVITTCTHGFVLAVSRVMTCTAVCLSALLTTKKLIPLLLSIPAMLLPVFRIIVATKLCSFSSFVIAAWDAVMISSPHHARNSAEHPRSSTHS